jgi:nucleoside-diphosphate-sugar epimerase
VLTRVLADAGHDIVGLDSDLYRRCTYGSSLPDGPCIRKDIRDVEVRDLQGFDAVVHLAALSNDPLGDLNADLTMDINHRASVRLAEFAKLAGVARFVFSSSCSIYGAAGEAMLTEEAELNPVTAYAASKVLVERDVREMADESFSPTFLRNATAYGVSPRIRFDLVLNNLVAWAYTTGLVFLKSDGSPWRPIVHIEDISRAFLAVIEAPREKVHNEAYNVGRNEENYRIRDLAAIVHEVVPRCRIEFAADAGPDKRNYRVDFSKFAAAFPVASWTARTGIQELYDSYKRNGFSREDFEGPRYKRIDHVTRLLGEGNLAPDLRWKTCGADCPA